jgi:lipopolysaccharide biosynthesis glycosyltransferase
MANEIKSNNKKVPVVRAANDFYVPYLSAVIRSIADNASPARRYKIVVLHRDISDANIAVISGMLRQFANFTIKFENISAQMKEYEDLYVSNHIKIETYYRFFIPEILPDDEKAVYIDCDTIVERDIGELYDEKIESYFIAGTRDADNAALYYVKQDRKQYSDEVLELTVPYDYFQAGVIVMNLELFRQTFSTKFLLDTAMERNWNFHDQDVLNYLCKGKVKIIDYAWNFVFDLEESWKRSVNVIAKAPHFVYEEYMKARENPKVIHFSWNNKPWHSPGLHLADRFWHYMRKTPFYETALMRMEKDLAMWIFGELYLKG